MAASGLIFIIACSNVANLILARTVRREGELSIRAALGSHLHSSDKNFLELLMTATAQGSPGVVLWMSLWILGATVALSSLARGRVLAQSSEGRRLQLVTTSGPQESGAVHFCLPPTTLSYL